MQTQRLNITLPDNLVRDLRRSIPERKRSRFIAQAVEEKLSKKKSLKEEWIKALRSEEYKKLAREIAEDFKYADAEIVKKLP